MTRTQFSRQREDKNSKSVSIGWILLSLSMVILSYGIFLVVMSPLGIPIRDLMARLFALDSTQYTWYITRSSGIMAYLLLWLSTAWGLAVPSKIFDRLLHRSFTFDFHQVFSLFSLGFLAIHILILLADQYLPYSLAQILVPFLSAYRPVWVGIGVISLYILLLVTGTFYVRQKIGMKSFRVIHYTSLIGYLGATAHGIFSGADSSLPFAMLMYFGTFLVIVFLTAYWIFMVWQVNRVQSTTGAYK
jgi:predicted ferric reductase